MQDSFLFDLDPPPPPGLLRMGTSSFSTKDWVGPFYPAKTKPNQYLRYYATRFDTVEIDATYYAVPRPETIDGWARNTPDSFIVSAKFPRQIVHGGQDARPDGDVVLDPDTTYPVRDEFLKVMSRLGGRLGPLVLQFPFFAQQVFPRTQLFLDRLDKFLSDLPPEFQYAVEVRNRRWMNRHLAELCRRHKTALVLVDQGWMPHGDEVEREFEPVTADFAYIRLLGDHREMEKITQRWDREVVDRNESLQRWSHVIARLLERDVKTFVYINNHYAGHAPATLRRLSGLLKPLIAGMDSDSAGDSPGPAANTEKADPSE